MNHKRYKINYDKNSNIKDNKISTKIKNIYDNSDMTPIILKEITLSDSQIGGNSVTSSEADTYTTTTTEVGSTINTSSLETTTDTTTSTSAGTETTKSGTATETYSTTSTDESSTNGSSSDEEDDSSSSSSN